MRMNSQEEVESLGSGPVGKLFFRLALPAIFSQFIVLAKNLLDRLFVGHIAECGGDSLTAIGVVTPIILFSTTIAVIIAGGAPLMSIFLGQCENEKAHHVVGSSLTFIVVASLTFAVVVRLFAEDILYFVGSSPTIYPYAESYLTIVVWGFLPVNLMVGLCNFLTGQGLIRRVMRLMTLSVVLNMVLDPILIFGLDMGIRGAAWANALSMIPSSLLLLRELAGRRGNTITLKRQHLLPHWKLLGSCLALGFSPYLALLCDTFACTLYNRSLLSYGGDTAVGAMAIFYLLYQIFYNLFLGLAVGMMPIITYSFGQGNIGRVEQCARLLFRSSFVMSISIWLILMIFPSVISHLFTNDAELAAYTAHYIRRYFSCGWLLGGCLAGINILRFLRQVKRSILLVVFQKILLTIPLLLLLPRLWRTDPVASIFSVTPTVDTLTAIVAIVLAINVIRKLKSEKI